MDFKEMDVWKHSRKLCKNVYLTTKVASGDIGKDLSRHAMKSSVSVLSNVSEGLGRQYQKEKIRFLVMQEDHFSNLNHN